MKKILAIALAAVMVLGLATSALAVSWAAPATSTTASPFAVEVVKLGVNTDITGGAYYTVLDDAAAYDYSTIYYAIKLSLPSYADANAYYGNSGFLNGNEVTVTITWTNVAGKSTQKVMVPLTGEAQTLWFDGTSFTSTWQQKLAASCGCGESHILSAVASGTKEVSVKACVGAEGSLSDVTIGGCYTVEEKKFYGVVPCVNCKPQNLSGWLFKGDCTAYNVFFSTNSAAKVTGAYVVDKGHLDLYYGGVKDAFTDKLYAWRIVDSTTSCNGPCVTAPVFALREINNDLVVSDNGANVTLSDATANWRWIAGNAPNVTTYDSTALKTEFDKWLSVARPGAAPNNATYPSDATDLLKLYTFKSNVYEVAGSYLKDASKVYASNTHGDLTKNADADKVKITVSSAMVGGLSVGSEATVNPWTEKVVFTGYEYVAKSGVVYGDAKILENSSSDSRLFQQTSATTINCDTNEAAYLNSLNHLYSLLGFTYADIAAGNVYMNKDILLANFGFSTSICDTATWGAYTAAITVAPVTEVPATGVASFAGFAMIAVAAAAAAVAKKRD